LGDIYCRKCGEPWDAYGVFYGDMTKEERKKFLRGEGCPCCDFGEKVEKKSRLDKEILNEAFWTSLAENSSEVEDYGSEG